MLRRLPLQDATLAYIDVDALRRGGILKLLAQGKGAVEAEYQAFLSGTGFDYEKDLDRAVGSFSPAGTFLLLKGRFDWAKLDSYAEHNGGSCYNKLCRMPGSVPERRISYLPLANDLMALAVSTDDLAASRMTKEGAAATFEIPQQPVWIAASGSVLRNGSSFPAATRIFTSTLGASELVTLTLGPASSGYELQLKAACKSAEDARVMTVQLTKLTDMLKSFLGKSKGVDFGSLLASGAFSQSGTSVHGIWPVPKELLDSLVK